MNEIENLAWQVAMGADEAIAETPVNWQDLSLPTAKSYLDKPVQALELSDSAASVFVPKGGVNSSAGILDKAQTLADGCESLADLKAALEDFDGLPICKTASHTVFIDGIETADILLIGEAPAAQEDKQAIPFCGDHGMLLDTALSYIDISRKENLLMTNSVFWRPPGSRRPTEEEIAVCKPFVQKLIALVQPKYLLLCGGIPATQLLETEQGITKLRGKEEKYHCPIRNCDISSFPLYHPSYLLKHPSAKKLFWQDLLCISSKTKG